MVTEYLQVCPIYHSAQYIPYAHTILCHASCPAITRKSIYAFHPVRRHHMCQRAHCPPDSCLAGDQCDNVRRVIVPIAARQTQSHPKYMTSHAHT